ncbi:MAG: S9 family peptidase [Hyphomonadaceae bacterium]
MLRRILLAFAAICLAAGSAAAKPPLEAFGDVPEVRSVELSPDGSKVAFLQRLNGEDVLVIYDLNTSTSRPLARVNDLRARYVHFVGDNYVVLVASKDTHTFGYRGRYEFSAAFAFDLATGQSKQLLHGTKDIFPAQSGLGRILGIAPGGKEVYMPAFMGVYDRDPGLDLLRVPLDSGRGGRLDGGNGSASTVDWLVNANGRVVVREDFNEKKETHEIRTRLPGGDWKLIYQKQTPLPEIGLVGISSDGKSLFAVNQGDSEFQSLYTMSYEDGAIEGPVLQRDDAEVVETLTDLNRVVYGVRYSGMYPRYDMFDAELQAHIDGVQRALSSSAVYVDSWSDNWSKILFFVEGGYHAERYMLYDRASKSLRLITGARPDIKPDDVGEVVTVEYKARDGLVIPSLITWPAGIAEEDRKNLPLVVLPHGGPEVYDSVGFDWLAQFLANEGYVVLQPNFRGSAGFGQSFALAGYGEWGRKMQDDITDGVNALVKMGWADPQRICIVGWSYGGYAALAGGMTTPDLYKCVVSIAGVSNLREMLAAERRDRGPRSQAVTYWELLIGDPDKDRDAIDSVSPALNANKFKAPVLLIHGASDTVVPVRQSELMRDALKARSKPVQYIRIEGDDHSLVAPESRNKALSEVAAFLKTHIGQ